MSPFGMSQAKPSDEYIAARNSVVSAVAALGKAKICHTPGGISLRINRKPPLRIYQLMITRYAPGGGKVEYNFQRDGWVGLGGDRGVSLGAAIAAGHEPWASREELRQLADELAQGEGTSVRKLFRGRNKGGAHG